MTVQVFRDNEPVITTPLHPIATEGMKDLQRIPYGADLALKDLSTGAYVLQVTVIDRRAKASATQRFSFQIEWTSVKRISGLGCAGNQCEP